MTHGKRWLLAVALLLLLVPLLYLPLRAQETSAAPSVPATEAAEPAEQAAADAEEHVSADNNLSFPVDI